MDLPFPPQLSPALLEVVAELGFTTPTPIQAAAIPLLLEGQDLVGRARTGSGKTLAFVLPMLQRLKLEERRLQALILCPTRELCAQVLYQVRKLGRKYPALRAVALSGGEPLRPQANALAEGVHVAVGTPGRVRDHLDKQTLALGELDLVVLDEADRMLDMGFADEMEHILGACPRARQTVFFSATFPESIAAMSTRWQRDPAVVRIDEEPGPTPQIRQIAVACERETRTAALLGVLAQHRPDSALIFCNLKVTAAGLAEALRDAGHAAAALHGDLEQRDRDLEMAKLRNGSVRVLVATDVAARGLDVEGLDLVVNYDLPLQPEIYVHRIGRTGRAGRAGLAVSLVADADGRKLARIEEFTGERLERQGMPAEGKGAAVVAAMRTLRILGGRKDKVRPGDILGALTGEAGISGEHVGKIEIHDHFAYVAISAGVAGLALERLAAGRIKGRRFRVEAVG